MTEDPDRNEGPSAAEVFAVMMAGPSFFAGESCKLPQPTARNYYDEKGALRPGYTPKTMGYTPNPVSFVASNKVEAVMTAIGAIESGGNRVGHIDYGAVGPACKNGKRAQGAWQVMEQNIPEWAKEASFKDVTVAQFMEKGPDGQLTARARQLQHDIVYHQFDKMLRAGYSPRDAASIWFTGHPERPGDTSSDGITSASNYVNKFAKNYAQVKVYPLNPEVGVASAASGLEKFGERVASIFHKGGSQLRDEHAKSSSTTTVADKTHSKPAQPLHAAGHAPVMTG